MNKKQNEVIQFLLKFKTATENQLIKLTNCSNQDINYLLTNKLIIKDKETGLIYHKLRGLDYLLTNKLIIKDKETGLIYHKLRGLDIKFMVALDVICKYQKDLQIYEKEKFPVIINFIVENISYDIIVARLIEQKRIFEMLDEVSSSDRIILVIENKEMYNIEDIKTNRECLICEYPLKIIGKIN